MSAGMALSALLSSVGLSVPKGMESLIIAGLKLDSRQVGPGDLFLALRGAKADGADFLEEAIRRGAAAVIRETEIPNLRAFVGPLFDAWHDFPSRKLAAFGVTGTNGKSTTTRLIASILRAAGRKVVSLGTIFYEVGDEVFPSHLTTPSPDVFFDLLARGVRKGCDALVMEVSSHALSQDRVLGMRFQRAVFTNLTQDHFDFHEGFEDYFAAKKKLFTEYLEEGGLGIVNLDSPYGERLLKEWKGPRLSFSRAETPAGKAADVTLRGRELSLAGTQLTLSHRGREFTVRSRLVGALNVENLLAAAAFGLSLDLPHATIAAGLAQVTVPGRNEVFRLPVPGAFAVVDYAHSPDALERVLESLRPLTPGRLYCAFGCGGDRDRKKRPLMGGIAERLADRVMLTSDNPRSEDPEAILNEIRGGMQRPEAAEMKADRRLAIRTSLEKLEPGDCLLVAGKGHEDTQITGSERRHFSDQEEISAWARERDPSWS